ncbi:hypothetical protein TNCV_4827151 [Trichonephila clavipes]|nr:hypothetical protein TNCV_4827151 [Trichonephila clavipes]
MVLDIVVVVSRTEHAVDEEDVAEIDKLLEVVGAVSITEEERISHVFQRTSLAGLALESPTSSVLGRPRSAMRDPHQALRRNYRWDYTPADRAARTC